MEETILTILNPKLLFNADYLAYDFFKSADLPVPIFFGIPTIAFHVQLTTIQENKNFIQETVLYLKINGMSKDEISDALCLDQNLVNLIIENNKKSNNDEQINHSDIKNTSDDFFIFYNLLTDEFIKGYMQSKDFFSQLYDMNYGNFNNNTYYYRKDISQSLGYKIFCLGDDFSNIKNIVPTQKDIISSYKDINSFDEKMYRDPRYLNEVYPVILTTAYSITVYNSNHYSAFNPFTTFNQNISYSSYFFNLINQFARSSEAQNEIKEYITNTKNNQIRQQNKKMSIKGERNKKAFEFLQKKYRKYSFFEGYIQEQMVIFETEFQQIIQNNGKSDITNNARVFYDSANNAIEELFKLTYDPYVDRLKSELIKDDFFENINHAKTLSDMKIHLNKYYENILEDDSLNGVKQKSDLENIVKVIKKENIRGEKSFQLGICDLFTLNVLCLYYYKDSTFSNIFKHEIQYLQQTLILVSNMRNQARHTFTDVDPSIIKIVHDNVIKLIDTCMNVSENDYREEILNFNDEDRFESFIGEYNDLEYLPEKLKNACNQLLRDVFDMNELYYSDCVISFEIISEFMINYSYRKIASIEELNHLLNNIPDDETEAIMTLIEKLPYSQEDKNEVLSAIGDLKIDMISTKKSISRNYNNISASSYILFAPLLLSVVDYYAFVELFDSMGKAYFEDFSWAINERKHNKQAIDWKNIKIMNDNFIKYCKTISSFNREEI